MATNPVGDITYTGALAELFPNGPYPLYGVQIPEYGGIPTKPQSENEVLEPRNVDGARYRVGGWHFPKFQMICHLAAANYQSALSLARELEMLRGDSVDVRFPIFNQLPTPGVHCWVIDIRAQASSAQIMGATSNAVPDPTSGQPPGQNTTGSTTSIASGASVIAVFTLQVFIP